MLGIAWAAIRVKVRLWIVFVWKEDSYPCTAVFCVLAALGGSMTGSSVFPSACRFEKRELCPVVISDAAIGTDCPSHCHQRLEQTVHQFRKILEFILVKLQFYLYSHVAAAAFCLVSSTNILALAVGRRYSPIPLSAFLPNFYYYTQNDNKTSQNGETRCSLSSPG